MIDHIVLVKFSEETTTNQLQKVIDQFKALQNKIPGIVDLQAGINFSEKSKQDYQLVLSVRFENQEALDTYNTDQDHQAVAAQIREIGRIDSIVVDIEV